MPTLQEIKDIAFARYIEKSTHRNFQNTISIEDGKIYELISTMVDSISASLTGGGGGGEANTASNIDVVGDGAGVFAQKVGTDLQFRQLISGGGVGITQSASAISISASTGGGISDGDKGDITVTGSGAQWTINENVVSEDKLNLSDNTTGNVSISRHGFVPKLPNDINKFLRGDGAWAGFALFTFAVLLSAQIDIGVSVQDNEYLINDNLLANLTSTVEIG